MYLDQAQLKTLTLLAEKLGISRAAVLRRGLERLAKEAIPVEEDLALEINRTDGRGCQEPWQSIHGARSLSGGVVGQCVVTGLLVALKT